MARWIASFTALMVLQAPICAFACLLHAEPAMAAPAKAQGHGDMPCHQEPATPDSGVPESSDRECGCDDDFDRALRSADDRSLFESTVAWSLEPPSALRFEWPAGVRSATPPEEIDLPPPDLLLVKSSLLL